MASYYDTSDTDSSDTWNTDLSDQYLFTTDTWEGQLNFSRGCTGPEQRCWLCTELTPWNQEMHRLGFELVERRPGKLCLRSVKHRYGGDIDWDWPTNVGKASFLVSWLLQYHPCIDELKLGYSVYLGFRMKALPFPISLRPTAGSDCRRTLRGLELQQTASACFETIAGASRACFELVDLDAVCGLERLKLTYAYVNPKFAAELAKLLRRNASSIKRATLARQLAQDECYNRLHLTWTEADLPGVTAALTSPLAVIEEFRLPYICHFSTTGLRPLFDALASSKCVRILVVCIKEDPGEKGRALCEMLKVNRSIKFLFLAIDHDGYKFVEDVSHALTVNASITKIVLSIGHIRNSRTATALSYILVRNKTAAKFFLHSPKTVYSEFVEEVSWALQQNKTIVKFGSARNCFDEEESFPFFEAVRRNRGALNRAVDFVVSPSLDRQCVEGFELFSGRPCLLKHLKKVTGKTEPEAKLAAAEYYRRDNYLLIAGIVRHSLKCHPAEGTQVDALNKDCWQAIARHLKVTDVIP
ncbi:uncharacterized protein LOC144162388 isoform X2 [Haemaphysalis longicornis]